MADTHVLLNGQWVPQQRSLRSIVEGNKKKERRRAEGRAPTNPIGLLSKTVIQSPTVNWILPGRIRDGTKNDILFVGEDFVQIKEVIAGGHLQHVAAKGGFGSTIRAAKILGESVRAKSEPNVSSSNDGMRIKTESSADTTSMLPQILILAMESNELIFMFADHIASSSNNQLEFHTCSLPLVKEVSFLEQPGEHLAVDPYSRAVAVGAYQSNIHLYRTKPVEEMREHFHHTSRDLKEWTPFIDECVAIVEGVILKMDFLYPEKDDRDHVILLVLYRRFDQKRIFRKIFEWNTNETLRDLKNNSGHALTEQQRNITPSLLIPLKQRSSFLLIYDEDISQFASPLAGGIESQTFPIFLKITERERPQYPGISPGKPVWTNWARPKRNDTWSKDNDAVYVVREDGVVMYLEAPFRGVGIRPIWAGRLDGHLGTAFAYYSARDQTRDPRFWASDFLIASGSMSNGQIIKIGDYQPPGANAVAPVDRITTMNFQFLETVPNWCPTMDIASTSIPSSNGSLRKRSKIYATGGRQPFGSVVELRSGYEALISLRLEIGLAGATGLWTFRDISGNLLFLVTFPSETLMLRLDPLSEDVESIESGECGINFDNATLAIASIGRKLIQITESCIAVLDQLDPELWLRQSTKIEMPSGSRILRADIHAPMGLIAIAVHDGTSAYVQLVNLYSGEPHVRLETRGDRFQVAHVPSSLLLFELDTCIYVFLGVGDGSFRICKVDATTGALDQLISHQMDTPSSQTGPVVVESVTILTHMNPAIDQRKYLLVCGLRNGSLYVVEIGANEQLTFEKSTIIPIGHTPVTVVSSSDRSTAFVYSGSDVCRVRHSGSIASFEINSLWITDRDRPWILHPPISRLCRPVVAMEDYASIFTAWTCITGDDIIIMHVSEDVKTVPRQLPVTGTPSRLLHCKELDVMVVGSAYTEADEDGGTRTVRPRLQSLQLEHGEYRIPTPDEPNDFLLPTGEKIHSMTDWLVASADGRKHVLLLVATSWMDGGSKGRLLILRLVPNEEGIVSAKKVKNIDGFRGPCTAVAILDETKVVLAAGEDLYLYEFSLQDRQARRRHKYELGCLSSYITVSEGLIHVSTAQNSLIVLKLVEDEEGNPELRPHFTEGQARKSLHHLAVNLPLSAIHGPDSSSASQPSQSNPAQKLILASDKDGSIVGLLQPSTQTNQLAARRVFEAALPRSITRLKRATIRPPWRQSSLPGVLVNDIVGTASDGALYGFSIVNDKAWRLLKFLENLVRWSKEMDMRRIAHSKDRHIIIDPDMMPGDVSRRLYHINGDTLEVFLGRSGESCLQRILAQDGLPLPSSGEPDPAMGPVERLETLKRLMKEVLGDQVSPAGNVISQACQWLQGALGPIL